jgi:hypothetical protein
MPTLNFEYKRLPNGVFRPLIRIEITTSRNSDGVPCEALIDSGADFNVLKADIGEILGIDVKSGQPFEFVGIGGNVSTGYSHRIWINVKNCWIHTDVVFSFDIPKGGHQVLGQLGFFDQFKVSLDYSEGKIILRSK